MGDGQIRLITRFDAPACHMSPEPFDKLRTAPVEARRCPSTSSDALAWARG
jgi:hypothetical protein